MLKIGIRSSAYFTFEKEEEGLALARKHGYECLDYQGFTSANSSLFQRTASEYEKYLTWLGLVAQREGVAFSQAHGLWPKDDSSDLSRTESLGYYKRQIEGCACLGSKYLVIHPVMPFGWGQEKDAEFTFKQNVETLQTILPYAKQYGVQICLENMPVYNCAVSKTEEVKQVVRAVDSPFVKICLDTGHSLCMQENIYKSVLTAGEDLAVLHVHDNAGSRQDQHKIPYQGGVDWDGFAKGLKEIGYKGCISLETAIDPKTPEPMRETLRIALANIARYLAIKVEE